MGGAPNAPPPSCGAPVSYPEPQQISPHILFQAPFSLCGRGPGLILVLDHYALLTKSEKKGDSLPLKNWASEGFAVVQLLLPCNVEDGGEFPIQKALNILKSSETCDFGNGVGLISYISRLPYYVEESICLTSQIKAFVSYGSRKVTTLNESATSIPPQLIHIAGVDLPRRESISFAPELPARMPPSGTIQLHRYEDAARDSGWMLPSDEKYHAQSANLAHTRSLAFLKGLLNGPKIKVEEVWEEFCHTTYVERDVGKLMATMVQDPIVKYIPTMTGGTGSQCLETFYTHDFLPSLPTNYKTPRTLSTLTVGPTHLIDQSTLRLTHATEIPWLLPNIPPTHRDIEVAVTTTVTFRGDRIAQQDITWDQGSVWKQVGLLPEWVGFPVDVDGKKVRVRLMEKKGEVDGEIA